MMRCGTSSLLLLLLVLALVVSCQEVLGNDDSDVAAIRRVRRVVEVADLLSETIGHKEHEAAAAAVPAAVPVPAAVLLLRRTQTFDQTHEEAAEQVLANQELYRVLQSSSFSMPPTNPTNPPIAPLETPVPTTSAPVDPPPVVTPTDAPVVAPTNAPVVASTPAPVVAPTNAPVVVPMNTPVVAPTNAPVVAPTNAPVVAPTTPAPVAAPISSRDQEIQAKCDVSAIDRSAALTLIASTVSPLADLNDPSSSRYQALDWITNVDPALLCPTPSNRIAQRYRAAQLYFHMGGEEWTKCGRNSVTCVRNDDDKSLRDPLPWLTMDNECLWFGLRCIDVPPPPPAIDSNDTVLAVDNTVTPDDHYEWDVIELPANNLVGEWPAELFTMSNLRALAMDGNGRISGSIPTTISNLRQLEFLDVDSNALTGTLPDELWENTNLLVLDLNDNQFTGTVSGELANLRQLNVLQLEFNQFTGTIPTAALFVLERLVALTINDNEFTGSVEEICAVVDERQVDFEIYLTYFHVDCNSDPQKVECSCCLCFPQ